MYIFSDGWHDLNKNCSVSAVAQKPYRERSLTQCKWARSSAAILCYIVNKIRNKILCIKHKTIRIENEIMGRKPLICINGIIRKYVFRVHSAASTTKSVCMSIFVFCTRLHSIPISFSASQDQDCTVSSWSLAGKIRFICIYMKCNALIFYMRLLQLRNYFLIWQMLPMFLPCSLLQLLWYEVFVGTNYFYAESVLLAHPHNNYRLLVYVALCVKPFAV